MKFGTQVVNNLLGIDESYKAPEKLMKIVLNNDDRNNTFKKFLKLSNDLSYDWFHDYFEDEQAQRKTKKQDFTPQCVADLMAQIVGNGDSYFEAAAGTGGIMISSWAIKPAKFYEVEEMSDRAVPFLLFNMSIRKMTGYALQSNSLTRECKAIYELKNGLIKQLPRNDETAKKFDVREWVDEF